MTVSTDNTDGNLIDKKTQKINKITVINKDKLMVKY